MTVKDQAVTIKGDAARVGQVVIRPQADGNFAILVSGVTQDSEGRTVSLKDAQVVYAPGKDDAIVAMQQFFLTAIRRVNGLEDETPIGP